MNAAPKGDTQLNCSQEPQEPQEPCHSELESEENPFFAKLRLKDSSHGEAIAGSCLEAKSNEECLSRGDFRKKDRSQGRGRKLQLLRALRSEDGSASVELVIFAMPLFIPLLMLASHAMALSSSKIEMAHLARTALRAFVTAPSTPSGHARVQQVLQMAEGSRPAFLNREFANNAPTSSEVDNSTFDGFDDLRANSGTSRFSYLIECRRTPCIQPSNRIRITVKDTESGVEVAATLYTDQWIQGEPGYKAESRDLIFGYGDVAEIEEKISPVVEAKEFADQIREVLDALPGR